MSKTLPNRDSRGRFVASYDTYVKMYKKKESQLARRGEEMAESMYTKEEWQAQSMFYEGRQKKWNLSINQYMVDRQTYGKSREQVAAYLNSIDFEPMEWVSDKTKTELRKRTGMIYDQYVAFMEDVGDTYHALRDDGIASSDASLLIAQEFFGSK